MGFPRLQQVCRGCKRDSLKIILLFVVVFIPVDIIEVLWKPNMEEARMQRVYLFDGTNFSNWSFRMELYLEELGLLHCIEKTLEEEDYFQVNPTADIEALNEEKRLKRKQQDA